LAAEVEHLTARMRGELRDARYLRFCMR